MGRAGERDLCLCVWEGPSKEQVPAVLSQSFHLVQALGRLAFATACVVFDQSNVWNESWGKEMANLAHVDETHLILGHPGEVSLGWASSELPTRAQ